MRKYSFLFVIILTLFINCSKDKNPITSADNYPSIYFPLKVGNTWFYDSPPPQSNPWATKTVRNSFIKDNTVYYTWTYGDSVNIIDSIRADEHGNIWKLINKKEYLWFDFSQDSGSTYIYNYPESFFDINYYYNVSVRKNITTETQAGVFDNCIELCFDIPQIKDEDRIYTFAPNVGLVRLQNNGWSTKKLTEAVIDGTVIKN